MTGDEPRRASTSQAVSPDSGVPWAVEGAWQTAVGVHRIPLPLPMDGLRAVNVYAIEHAGGLTLIDGGWALEVSRASLVAGLASMGASVRDIDRFLVTHVHRDHYTQASVLGRELGVPVQLGKGERATLDRLHSPTVASSIVSALTEAGADQVAAAWNRADRNDDRIRAQFGYPTSWLSHDQHIDVGDRSLRALHTPGHTPGHMVFADLEAGLLFAGDHVLPTITPSIGFVEPLPIDPLGNFLTSLTKILALPDLTLLPAHGPVSPSSHARVRELLTHHDTRLRDTMLCLQIGPSTAADVAARLSWTRRGTDLRELDVFNRGLAVLETKAHLDVLAARGDAVASNVDGRNLFTVAAADPAAHVPRRLDPSCQ